MVTYLLTFSCYGARLHGDERGTVDRNHNLAGAPYLPCEPTWTEAEQRNMLQARYYMDAPRRRIVIRSILEVCAHRCWLPMAVHVRSSHVHVVLDAPECPEPLLTALKAYASRALNQSGLDAPHRRRWSRHGSTRYLWNRKAIDRAVGYVAGGQGEPMELFLPTPGRDRQGAEGDS
jgi:hypothetical protein